ncbi:MAG: hypothetical protein HYR55_01105 [Acidobacteria bacterium]|nr:hypothetical protein [Acidobacteriota bacterium]MBI3655618.1 hypothetical protein [Acidobacteriota bacterium]
MLSLHRLFIKTAVVYLMLGSGLGGFLLLNKGWFQIGVPHELITIHNHIISVGFILMMIMGVAYWMFPRPAGVPLQKTAREPLAWANYFLLNVGLILRIVSEPFPQRPGTGKLLGLSALLQMLGLAAFVLGIWKRVRFPLSK